MTAIKDGATDAREQARDIEQSLLVGGSGDRLALRRFPQRLSLAAPLHLRTRFEPVPSWCGQIPRSTTARTHCDRLASSPIQRSRIA